MNKLRFCPCRAWNVIWSLTQGVVRFAHLPWAGRKPSFFGFDWAFSPLSLIWSAPSARREPHYFQSVAFTQSAPSARRGRMCLFSDSTCETWVIYRTPLNGLAPLEHSLLHHLCNPQKITCIIFENLFGPYFLPHQSHSPLCSFFGWKSDLENLIQIWCNLLFSYYYAVP